MLGVFHNSPVEISRGQCFGSSRRFERERSTAVPVWCPYDSVGRLRREVRARFPTISLQTESIIAGSEPEKNGKVICFFFSNESQLTLISFRFRLKLLHQFTKLLVVVFFWRFLLARSKKLRDLWSRVLGMMISMFKFLPISA